MKLIPCLRFLSLLFLACGPLSLLALEQRPNVLFIAVDDLRPELATYGADVQTPNFDRLAAAGLKFDRAYCQQAVCGASRLSLMGGLYPTRTGEQTFHVQDWRKRWPNLVTMNQHFRQQGYQVVGLGKIYHGTKGPGVDPDNWDQWLNPSAPMYALAENRERVKKSPPSGDPRDPAKGPMTEMADVADTDYADGLRAVRAAEWIREFGSRSADSGDDAKPFFLAVGLTKPHLPFNAPMKYWDLYQREDFQMPPNAGIPPGYPAYAANLQAGEMSKYSDFEGDGPTDFSDDLNRRLLHGYAACTSYADANLGRILDALQTSGLADNTIVVLWGDHGWKLGDHSSWCKHTNFECDTRVPLIIRVPGKQESDEATHSTSRLVELIDLYPTLCDLTGIETPGHCQGRSFAKLFDDPSAGHRWAAYSSYPAGGNNRETGHSIRFGNYRYTEWRDTDSVSPTGKRVLTQIKKDPGEETNVVDDPQHAEALARAEELLEHRIRHALRQAATPDASSGAQPSAPAADPRLKEAARGKFKIGVGTDLGVFNRPQDLALLKHHFNVVTPENCMKATKVQAEEGKFDFTAADQFMDLAELHGLEVVGHNLIWSRPGTTPAWFFQEGDQPVSRERLLERLRTHIHAVVGRYRGRIASWDVVNEALADSNDEYLRRNEWMDVLGEEFLVKAYQYAREADPDALLIYNDYRCDQPGKLEKLVRLIRSAKEQGAPIDVLGLQAHYEYGMIPYEGIERALVEMRKLGVRVVFSELDMDVVTRIRWYVDDGKHREEMKSFNPYPGELPADVLASQADQYARLFQLIGRHADVVDRVTFWNLHDGQSWMNDWPWPRTNHPLLFDRQREAKPAFHAVVQSLDKLATAPPDGS